MTKMPKKDITVVYHKNCLDGFGAAWAAWLKFKDQAAYLPAEHNSDEAAVLRLSGKTVFLVDFGYSAADKIKRLVQNNQKVVLIDHHLSQKALRQFYTESVYNEKHSAAVLAWQYFHRSKPVPKLLQYIEDIDLWQFKLPYTRELMAALDTYEMEFSRWGKIARHFQSAKTRKKYLEEGKSIIRYQHKVIERLVNYAEEVSFAGYSALAVNSPVLVSEIGNALSQKSKTFAVIWRYKKGGLEVSLRSTGRIDVSKIAEKYGGGGHRAAAGFIIKGDKKPEFPWKKIK